MKDSKELWLCSLPMKKGILDDDYRFFDDGTIIHEFDKSQYKLEDLNLQKKVLAKDIPINVKLQIMELCPVELKTKIANILEL